MPTTTRIRSGWRFPAFLLLCLAILLVRNQVGFGGDALEYAVTTVGIASHGRPDIRMEDIARTEALAPHLTGAYAPLQQDMRSGAADVYPAYARGRDGRIYSMHFFGYPLLTVVPFKLLAMAGLPPFKGFLVVNYGALFILGLALRRFFGSSWKAVGGLALFFGCGGVLYYNWSSPECLSAAALLAALLFWLSEAPLAGGLLAGLAATQNPTIAAFFGFAPLLKALLGWRRADGTAGGKGALPVRRDLLGLALGLALFALPLLFNLAQYGVPSLIARRFSDPALVGLARLASFYFDLNQGMVIGIPAVLAALALWGWRSGGRPGRQSGVLALCLLFSLALALPTLAVLNWNSGAVGMMRYAFWGAMPILLALLLRLREHARWPTGLVAALALAQALAMTHALSYEFKEFSPLARQVLARAPGWYHPEPEIFAERAGDNDNYIKRSEIYRYRTAGGAAKTLFHPSNPRLDELLCGKDALLAPDNRITDSAYGWRYIDGEVRCSARLPEAGLDKRQHISYHSILLPYQQTIS
jgi:hypothetical protein